MPYQRDRDECFDVTENILINYGTLRNLTKIKTKQN